MRKLLYILIFLFFSFSFDADSPPPPNGWYQQWMPDLSGASIRDIIFTDSLNGYAVTNIVSVGDTGYILKTTNGGDNWNFVYGITRGFTSIQFINISTGFASGGSGGGAFLIKTTNEGLNWFSVNCPPLLSWDDMHVLNEDTLWLVEEESLTGGVFRTTNGGVSWQQQLSLGSQNPTNIYFYDRDIGFICKDVGSRYVRKTTNGGLNWFIVENNDYFSDIYFADSLIGWKCSVFGMKKTTNGGVNWTIQSLPSGGIIQVTGILRFSSINRDTIWGVGGYAVYPNSQVRGILYRTTNGGDNWLYQIPDTSIHIGQYNFIKFIDHKKGWTYSVTNTGIHTTVGGDTTFTNIKQMSTNTPNEYKLYQNYPNPFNYSTRIKFDISKTSNVKLKVYNLLGKEIDEIVNSKVSAGSYDYRFIGSELSSGVYLYRLSANGKAINTKNMLLIK